MTSYSLSIHQVAALKENIIDLEASLANEKEFNSEHHRLNAEYLVNIIKRFLTTEDKSEQAQLVLTITQILHLRPDERKDIVNKWSVTKQPSGGGWWFGMTRSKPSVTPAKITPEIKTKHVDNIEIKEEKDDQSQTVDDDDEW
jgi:hypothetical protein